MSRGFQTSWSRQAAALDVQARRRQVANQQAKLEQLGTFMTDENIGANFGVGGDVSRLAYYDYRFEYEL
jgi:hypothetical protein